MNPEKPLYANVFNIFLVKGDIGQFIWEIIVWRGLSRGFNKSIDVLVRPLILTLNQPFKQDIFPEILKIAQISLIPKIEDTVTVSNYRPISFLSVFSKIFEKVFYHRIYSFLYKNKLINAN